MIDAVSTKQGKLLRVEPIAQQMVEDRIRLRGAFVDLGNEWVTWQPTDTDSRPDRRLLCTAWFPRPTRAPSCTRRCRPRRSPTGSGAAGGGLASAYGRRIGK
ncbi:hypothetical protein [Streptomyces griseofuscus]|uniref:hypothetical protein n=1 Tax=Streptomyces griseofuscus TaxID=146922 RepID=UPI003807F5E0